MSEYSLACILLAVPAPRRAAALPPEERREALIAATLPLVLEHGTDVSTRLIAEAAGVAEGTIFRAFPSKDDLIEAVVASAFDPSSLVESIAGVDPSLPLTERLVAAVQLMQAHGRRLAGLIHAFAARGTLRHRGESGAAADRRHRVSQFRAAEGQVVDALAVLLLPDRDRLRYSPEETARRLRLVTVALSSPRLADTEPLPAEEIVSLFLDGVRRHRHAPGDAPATPAIGATSC
jgi:AcrR family transcriptional regulator